MALQSFGKLYWPDPAMLLTCNSLSSSASYQINGSGNRLAWQFQIPKSGTITKCGIRINTCASAVTSRLGLYTLDGSFNPTSTGYGSSAYGTFTPAANTYSEVTLGTPATATLGDYCALVVEFDSTAGDYFVSAGAGTNLSGVGPFARKYTASWASVATYVLMGHILYNDGSYGMCQLAPFTGVVATGTYNSGSSPNEYALKFTPPFACRVVGIGTSFAITSPGSYDAILYSGTTSIASGSATVGQVSSASGFRQTLFTTPVTLTAGSTYRAAIKATSANNVTYQSYPLFAAGAETALGLPSGSCQSTRGGGAWTDATTNIPGIWLILDQLDDGAGSLLQHPGMAGGFKA